MGRSKKQQNREVKPSKFKTTLCQFFLKGEGCPFGDKCAFAHGESELRVEADSTSKLPSAASTAAGIPASPPLGNEKECLIVEGDSTTSSTLPMMMVPPPAPTAATPSRSSAGGNAQVIIGQRSASTTVELGPYSLGHASGISGSPNDSLIISKPIPMWQIPGEHQQWTTSTSSNASSFSGGKGGEKEYDVFSTCMPLLGSI